ncbi:MAG: type III-A CRISPR-associated protein Cas10/Csm1 [Anaerolineae bacterium]
MTSDRTHLIALAGLLRNVERFAQRANHPSEEIAWIGGEYTGMLQEREAKIITLADRLAAARRSESESDAWQLASIFCQIGEEDKRPPQQFWPLKPLALSDDALFPGDALPAKDATSAHGVLWTGFAEAVQELTPDDLPAYLERLYYALQRFAWCVPLAYEGLPGVSLFDHSRTTAALAASLADLDEALIKDVLGGKQQTEPLVLLVGGDLSGVQDFIYTITARGAAKGLRGRSFYLQLLTEAVARFILRELGLPVTNLLYAGGGHFYLLTPLDAEGKLKAIQAEVSRKLLLHHGGDLYLALGWTEVSAQDFDREHFGDKWQAVSQQMNAAKRQRFAELGDAELLGRRVFGPLGQGGDEKGECQVCHYDGPVKVEREGTDEERRICRLCRSLEELGTHLRDADYLLLGEVEPEDTAQRSGYAEALRSFGVALGLTVDDGSAVLPLPDTVQRATLLAMRDLPDVAGIARRISQKLGCPVAHGTRYTVNVTPRKPNGDIATFDWLQKQCRGVKRLGVLRMDVDDLGDLLRWGMQEATLSRVASLSFALSLFFEGWMGELCRRANRDAGVDKVYAIYSGGDDLFIVGAWDALPGLADTIRQHLASFAAHNRAVHISGGLTLHAGKYPLYQAAADAEDALGAAKDTERPEGHNKDAFDFLDVTIPWEEFDAIRQEQENLVRDVTAADEGGLGISHALLRTLLRLHTRYTDAVYKHGKPRWGPWMWRGAYFLRRMEERYKEGEKAQKEIKRIRESLGRNEFRYIETLGPAARWAELLTRKESER